MASTTTNLGLTLTSGSDLVDPATQLTANFEILDKLGLDYVIKQGTSGDWWYRIWKSGRAECGVDSKQFATKNSTKWGSLYSAGQYQFSAYPIVFSAPPFVTIMYRTEDNSYGGIIHIHPTAPSSQSNLLTRSPTFSVADPNGPHTYSNPKFGCYATGLYKEMASSTSS